MQVLVTGGAGFIGSHLVRWLVGQNHAVRVLDNLSTGRRAMLGPAEPAVELVIGDIRDPEVVRSAVAGVDLVFHLAAMVSVVQSVEQPLLAYEVNTIGTLNLLEAARHAGVRRVVQASSCAIYGNTERLPVGETEPPQPFSPYAATKLAAEQSGQLYTQLYGLDVVALRFFNVYGPRQDPNSPYAAAVPRFMAKLAAGQQPTIYGDGGQSRDFVFVDDIVSALWIAATAPAIAGEVFNVGRGEAISIRSLVDTIGDLLGVQIQPHFAAARAGEVRHSCANVAHFAERAGFRARVSLREGLAAIVKDNRSGG